MSWLENQKPQSSCNDAAEVRTHFRIPIPVGQSTFTVQVPKHHLQDNRRRFFFNQLHLTPDFYSLEAEKLNLDADPEMDRILEHSLRLKVNYNDVAAVYGPAYETTAKGKTMEVLAKLNKYFEEKKPAYAYTTPFFIDWIDTDMAKEETDYVPLLANIYYGVNYNEIKHKNVLPESVQGLPGVNNFALPLDGNMPDQEMYNARIRLRLWLAPYTKVIFSNVQAFVTDLGFAEEQMGEATNRQNHLTNNTAFYLPVVASQGAPKIAITVPKIKLALQPSSSLIINRVGTLSIVQRDWLDNAKLIQALAGIFKQASQAINVVFSAAFDKDEKKFQINFPVSDNVAVQVVCEPDFANRLGFGFQAVISKGMQAQEQKDRHSTQDAQKRASSVVFDTGPIVCTLDQVSSNTTSGSLYQAMTALYPRSSGTLSMPNGTCPCSIQSSPSTVALNVNMHSGTGDKVPVTFRLLRIYDNQSISEFAWTCNGYIYGVLQGSCPVMNFPQNV